MLWATRRAPRVRAARAGSPTITPQACANSRISCRSSDATSCDEWHRAGWPVGRPPRSPARRVLNNGQRSMEEAHTAFPTTGVQSSERIDALDILRGIALLGMFFVHFNDRSIFTNTGSAHAYQRFVELFFEDRFWG